MEDSLKECVDKRRNGGNLPEDKEAAEDYKNDEHRKEPEFLSGPHKSPDLAYKCHGQHSFENLAKFVGAG
jgi:hypothetical protein